ncbi:gamma-glutamylcyclotransferase [Ottowia sp.]|uniref:gamma-glutamylcyclotransferase n=1 Tax=Ottowia sp. TaxID=1898956 RepID=UPI003A8C0453
MRHLDDSAHTPYAHLRQPGRDPLHMLARTRAEWQQQAHGAPADLWVFGYGSLIWRPDFEYTERHPTRVHGWHRALAMWSRVNRGTPEQPGLVFALLHGGSCQGVVYRIAHHLVDGVLTALWAREMPSAVYDTRWLPCATPHGTVLALAFTLSRRSPAFTGELTPEQYRHIFHHAHGRYGSTLDYAQQTHQTLHAQGIHDRRLAHILSHAVHRPPQSD